MPHKKEGRGRKFGDTPQVIAKAARAGVEPAPDRLTVGGSAFKLSCKEKGGMWLLTCHATHGRDCCQVGVIEQGIFDPASYAKGQSGAWNCPEGREIKSAGCIARATLLLFLV